MKIVKATEIVLDLAAQQWGLVTTAQAGFEGVSAVLLSRLVGRAVITRIRSGVYVAEAVPWSQATEIRAQWLALEPKVMAADRLRQTPVAVVSHESAAELHGIGDLDSNGIHFTVPTRRQTRQPEVVFHIAEIDSPQWESIEGLAVTTPLRTVKDLAAAGHEPGHLADMTGDILHAGLATREEVADLLATIPHAFGITPGSRTDVAAWLDERFPSQVLSAEQLLQRQIEAAWAPVREELQALIKNITPLTTPPDSIHSAGAIIGLHLEGVSERFGDAELLSKATELAQHSGITEKIAPAGNDSVLGREAPHLPQPDQRPARTNNSKDHP